MTALRNSALICALAIAASAHAQDANAPAPGAPQQLQPSAPAEQAPSDNDNATTTYRATPSVLGSGGAAPVQVGALGTVEGPIAGMLDDGNGGLGYSMWSGSERAAMEAMLLHAPAASTSPASRMLLQRLLLTSAPPPEGPWRTPFMALRIQKLLEAGEIGDASNLAAQIHNSNNAEIAHAQAEALLYAGRDADACGDTTAYRLQDAAQYWIELRAYCYAVTNDAAALDLTRAVIAAQEIQDPAFLPLLDALAGVKPKAPIAVPAPTALHVRMFERLKMPIAPEMIELGVPASLVALRSAVTPPNVRLAAAAKVLRAGALSGPQLSQVLALQKFKPQDLTAAAALAPSEDPMQGLARLKAALKTQADPGKRAELIYTAFRIGEREGLFAQVTTAFADEAAALQPSADWSGWAALMARGLVMAGRPDAARLWLDMIVQRLPQLTNTISELELIFALGAPSEAQNALSQASLSWLADQASEQNSSPGDRAKAALYIGLFDALGRPLSPALQARVPALINSSLPGRRPAPAGMARVEAAALGGRRGEAVLAIISAMGPQGPAGLAPDVTVRFVRALQTLGLPDLARALATEAAIVPAPAAQG
jgi:hypothetical protein